MPSAKKITIVANLKDKLAKAKSLIFTDFQGVTHKQFEQIKKAVKATGGEFLVVKNKLLQIALDKKDLGLKGQTALLLSYDDEIAPLKELAKFIKNLGKIDFKLGFLGKLLLSKTEVATLSKLPNKEVLLIQLVTFLKNPIQRLHLAFSWNIKRLVINLNTIKNSKT